MDTELAQQADQVWVIGGSSLYQVPQNPLCNHHSRTSRASWMCVTCGFWAPQELMERTGRTRLFVTQILKQFECDTFFPEIDPARYRRLPQ